MKLLTKNILNLHNIQGQAWLDNLPNTINAVQSLWQLHDLVPVENMTYHYVAKAYSNTDQAVVIKIGYDNQSIANEVRALGYFNGKGAIQLIDHDTKHNALLLQQAVPGITLKSLSATDPNILINHYVQVMQRLHSTPFIPHQGYPQLVDWLTAIDRTSRAKFPAQLLDKAIQIKDRLLKTTDSPVFLHGDLHLDNILKDGNQWISIDPKGVVGDPAFEIFALDFIENIEFETPASINALLNTRCDYIAKVSHLDAERIKEWTFVRLALSAAWHIEDNGDPSWAINIATKLECL